MLMLASVVAGGQHPVVQRELNALGAQSLHLLQLPIGNTQINLVDLVRGRAGLATSNNSWSAKDKDVILLVFRRL